MKRLIRIYLKYVEFDIWCDSVVTRFADGTECAGTPHETPDYLARAMRLGYGNDIMAYLRDHELAHNLIAQELWDKPSPVLHAVAKGQPLSFAEADPEERLVINFQGFLRQGECDIEMLFAQIGYRTLQSLCERMRAVEGWEPYPGPSHNNGD